MSRSESEYVDYLEAQVNSLRREWINSVNDIKHAKEDKEVIEIELARMRDILLRAMSRHKKADHPSLDDPLKVADLLREYITLVNLA